MERSWPETLCGLAFRDGAASLLYFAPFANLAVGSGLKDDFELPEYEPAPPDL